MCGLVRYNNESIYVFDNRRIQSTFLNMKHRVIYLDRIGIYSNQSSVDSKGRCNLTFYCFTLGPNYILALHVRLLRKYNNENSVPGVYFPRRSTPFLQPIIIQLGICQTARHVCMVFPSRTSNLRSHQNFPAEPASTPSQYHKPVNIFCIFVFL